MWLWAPERRVLCSGDLFIWASPNCGNPQKVQRYAIEWAHALRTMATLDADVLLPGHGLPILGSERIRTALTDSARLLEHLHNETIRMMNEGATLDAILQTVRAPADLLDRPYLGPIYDEPEFVVRNVWRLFGGWYDGDPSHLKPAPSASVRGRGRRARRRRRLPSPPAAEALAAAGDLRLAAQLVELAAQAEPDDASVHGVRAAVYRERVAVEASVMAQGVFAWAARESELRLAPPGSERVDRTTSSLGRWLTPSPRRRGPTRARRHRRRRRWSRASSAPRVRSSGSRTSSSSPHLPPQGSSATDR